MTRIFQLLAMLVYLKAIYSGTYELSIPLPYALSTQLAFAISSMVGYGF